ncbi:MAG: hypothetical protein R6V10_13715 [bacterium]
MIIEDPGEIKERVREFTNRRIYGDVQIIEDTSDYMSIYGGMVLRIAGNDYFLTGDATEGRFGIDDQPKFWVKYAYDLEDGSRKVIKMVFYEDFTSREGPFLIKGSRSPEKEAHCLEVVEGHPRFMQGMAVRDKAENLVRIIEFVRGKSLFVYLCELDMDHEEYFYTVFPAIMEEVIGCIEALAFMQEHGEHHGDVRNDHIIIEKGTGAYKWIDFDFSVSYEDYDIWSIGNVITFAAAKRIISFQEVKTHPERFPRCNTGSLSEDDALLFYKYRVANLKKLFPYIPSKLNRILMNFSQGTYFFYESYQNLVSDLREAMEELPKKVI